MALTEYEVGTGAASLRTLGYNLATTRGWEHWPGKRGRDLELPGMDGALYLPNKPYAPGRLSLALFVLPVDPATGAVTTSPEEHIQANLETLFGLLHSTDLISVKRSVDGGTTQREALVEPIDAIPVDSLGAVARGLVARFVIPGVWWRVLPQVTGAGASVNPGGSAPVHDAVYTLSGTDVEVSNPLNGERIKVNGGGTTVVDCAARTVKQGGSDWRANFERDTNRWMVLEPGVTNNLSVTGGTVSIDYYTKTAV